MALVTESLGKTRKPPARVKLVVEILVKVELTLTVVVAKKTEEVALVKTPVDGVVAPIGVLLIVPPEIVRPSTTMALVTESLGKTRKPLAKVKLVVEILVKVELTLTVVVAKKTEEVALVKTPVDGVVAPIGTLLMEPPVKVRLPTTMASVTESAGKTRKPETVRLVVETLVKVELTPVVEVAKKLVVLTLTAKMLVGLKVPAEKVLAVTLSKNALVEERVVPLAVVKVRAPDKMPPASGR